MNLLKTSMDIVIFGRSDERLSEAYGRHRWPTGSMQSGFACQPLLSIDAIITYFPQETEHAGTCFCLDTLTMPSIATGRHFLAGSLPVQNLSKQQFISIFDEFFTLGLHISRNLHSLWQSHVVRRSDIP
jgi:hypothetical protein